MSIYERFVDNIRLRRVVVLAFLAFVLYLVRGEMNTILLTFIFTLLIVRLVNFVQKHVPIPSQIIVIITYAIIVAALYFAITKYLPQLAMSSVATVESIYKFYQDPSNDTTQLTQWISHYISSSDIIGQVKGGAKVVFDYVQSVGSFGVTIFISMILSFFFTIEEKQMAKFSKLFLTSDYGWFFQDVNFFATKLVNTFGIVLEAQFFIAICNTILTTIGLIFMGFPQIPTLAIMVFMLSLVPVAGVIISSVPLAIIAYSVGGFQDVVYVLIMILLIHTLETYVLNPQFMSSRTELPIFYTFVVLIAGEALMGIWGLIVGVPLFVFFLDILGVKSSGIRQQVSLKRLKKRYNDHHQD